MPVQKVRNQDTQKRVEEQLVKPPGMGQVDQLGRPPELRQARGRGEERRLERARARSCRLGLNA